MKTRVVFVEVDCQHDFVEGSLAVSQARDRIGNMAALSKAASVLVGSVDTHDHTAWEFSTNSNRGPNDEKPNFPPHCVKGTPGWLRHRAMPERADAVYIPNTALLTTDMDRWLEKLDAGTTFFFEKEVYSLYANPNASLFMDLISRRAETDTVCVYGIATDYCVNAAAMALREDGYDVFVVTDAIGAVDPSTEEALRGKWLENGIKLVTTSEALEIFETKKEE